MAFTKCSRLASFSLATTLLCHGCGPLHMPMPVRLEQKEQTAVDDAWNHALEPIDRLNDVALLDTLLTTQAYQVGVDRVSFRSEKRCAAGLVVMEIHADRQRPDKDLFSVTIIGDDGVVRREANYFYEDVAGAYRALFIEKYELEQRSTLIPEEQARLEELRARLEVAKSVFPVFEPGRAAME